MTGKKGAKTNGDGKAKLTRSGISSGGRCSFSPENNNIRLTPLNLYWQVEIINNIPVSMFGRGPRCVYNDPKLVIWSPGYRSRAAFIYRIIIQRLPPLLVIDRRREHWARVRVNGYIYNGVEPKQHAQYFVDNGH